MKEAEAAAAACGQDQTDSPSRELRRTPPKKPKEISSEPTEAGGEAR